MPGAKLAPAASFANWKKQTSVFTTGEASTGIPCAMVDRLLRALPGVSGLLATVAREIVHELDPSVEGTGPHGLTERAYLRSPREPSRPPLPASRFVTIGRNIPLHEAGFRIFSIVSDFPQVVFVWQRPRHDERIETIWKIRFSAIGLAGPKIVARPSQDWLARKYSLGRSENLIFAVH